MMIIICIFYIYLNEESLLLSYGGDPLYNTYTNICNFTVQIILICTYYVINLSIIYNQLYLYIYVCVYIFIYVYVRVYVKFN